MGSIQIVLLVIGSQADDTDFGPVHLHVLTQRTLRREFEVATAIGDPIGLVEALVDQFRRFNLLVFHDDRIAVFRKTEGIDPPRVLSPG